MKKILLLLPLALHAGPLATLRWDVDARKEPAPFVATLLQGESIGLAATFQHADIPAGATAAFLWQTNGMGSAWWTAPATIVSNTVSATWAPTNDVGATAYPFFLQVSGGGATLYRAFGTLRMRASPGATPNALPLPRQSLDFATVEVANAPYYAKAEVDDALTAKQDALTFDSEPTAGSTNPVTSGGVKTTLDGYLPLDGGTVAYLHSEGDVTVGSGGLSRITLNGLNGEIYIGDTAYNDQGVTVGALYYNGDGITSLMGGGTLLVPEIAANATIATTSDLSPDWQTVNAPGAAVTITHNGRTPTRIVRNPSGALAITISSASPSATEMSIEGATSVTFAATGGATVRVGGGVFRPGLENHFSIRKSFDGSIIINWLYAL